MDETHPLPPQSPQCQCGGAAFGVMRTPETSTLGSRMLAGGGGGSGGTSRPKTGTGTGRAPRPLGTTPLYNARLHSAAPQMTSYCCGWRWGYASTRVRRTFSLREARVNTFLLCDVPQNMAQGGGRGGRADCRGCNGLQPPSPPQHDPTFLT